MHAPQGYIDPFASRFMRPRVKRAGDHPLWVWGIRTTDLRVLSKDLESVPHSPSFIRICATGSAKQLPNERWFTLARHTPLVD